MLPPLGFFIIALLGIRLGVHKHYFGAAQQGTGA
jgi:hypothetical protein